MCPCSMTFSSVIEATGITHFLVIKHMLKCFICTSVEYIFFALIYIVFCCVTNVFYFLLKLFAALFEKHFWWEFLTLGLGSLFSDVK